MIIYKNVINKNVLNKIIQNPDARMCKGPKIIASSFTDKGLTQKTAEALRSSRLYNSVKNFADTKTPLHQNKELIEAFNELGVTESDGYVLKLCNATGLRATLSGEKPLTYFDDNYNRKAINTVLKYSNEIERQTGGVIKPMATNYNKQYLVIFNTKKLKQTISENLDFYKMHFPDCSSSDEIYDALIKKTEAGQLGYGSLMGVSLGFPLGDSLLFSTNGKDGEKISDKKLLELLKDDMWEVHRNVIKNGRDENMLWKTKRSENGGYGYATWNPHTPAAQNINRIMYEDSNKIFKTNIMDYFKALVQPQ